MKKLEIQRALAHLAIILAVEIWSYVAFASETLAWPAFIFIALVFTAVSIYRLEYALLAIISELIIGSMGRLFYVNIASFSLSIRTAFFLILFTVFVIKFLWQIYRDGKESRYLANIKSFKPIKIFALLGFFVVLGLFNAILKGQSSGAIFSDINAWLFFLLVLPFTAAFDFQNKKLFSLLKIVVLSAIAWLGLKTLLLLAVFTHNLYFAPDIYLWLRKTLTGEMTPTKSGWPRIFIQSQVFSAASFFVFFWLANLKKGVYKFFSRNNIFLIILSALSFAAVIISFSRSFWLAFVVATGFSLLLVWILSGFKSAFQSSLWILTSIILSFVMIYAVVAFPYFNFQGGNLDESLMERVSGGSEEAALASRWSLLPKLWSEVIKYPFSGQGFGASVTYYSSDPRVLQSNPSGEYTTSAFEWGYLDIWLKIGLGGLLTYLFLVLKVLLDGLKRGFLKRQGLYFGLSIAILFLAITNAFTPYLNHPLGIGLFLLSSCLIYKNELY